MKLINRGTGAALQVGDTVTSFRGTAYILRSWRPPHKPSSQGHVYVWLPGDAASIQREFYASVIDAEFVA